MPGALIIKCPAIFLWQTVYFDVCLIINFVVIWLKYQI